MFIPGKNLFHPREKFWFFWKTYENIAKNKVNLESKLYFVFEKNCKIKFCSQWVEKKSRPYRDTVVTDKGERVREDVYVSVGSVYTHLCVLFSDKSDHN